MPKDRDAEESHDMATFVAELRRLADALEAGEDFAIEVDGETVAVPRNALLSVAHEREDGEVELEFQLTWSEAESEDDEDEADEDEDEDDKEDEEDEDDKEDEEDEDEEEATAA